MSNAAEEVIRVRHVEKSFDHGRVPVLRDVSLSVRPGQLVALWGASGSGKSTLLHLIGGLDLADRGEVTVCGLDPREEPARLLLRRRHLGFVFQLHNLIPDLTLAENVSVPALAVGSSAAAIRARTLELTERLGIAHRLEHRIQDLSGGERQRTAICRALMNAPRVLLADEPTGSLDEESGENVFALLKELAERDGLAVVLATHERRFAEACHRLARMRSGRLEETA